MIAFWQSTFSLGSRGITKIYKEIIDAGQIGDLAVIRICHTTLRHMPIERHDPDGPPFHDCMHYVDVARWYAKSEYPDLACRKHSHVELTMWN